MSSAVVTIDLQESIFIVLGLIIIGELHLDETETTTSLSVFVSHYNSISHNTKLLKILN